MKKTLALAGALLLLATGAARADDPAAPGAFTTRSQPYTVNVENTTASIDIRLPAAGSFARPVVVICHGWLWSIGSYEGIAEHLASRGFAAVLFQQPNRFSTDTQSWANRMRDVITELGRLNANPKSGVFGELDMNRVGIMGHSYGGACVTLLAGQDPRVKCVVALSPVNQYHYWDAVASVGKTTAPYLALGGSIDPLCPGLYTRGFYHGATKAAAREFVEVKGGAHFMYMGGDANAKLCSRYYTAWLERFLMGKADPGQYTTGQTAAAQLQQGVLTAAEHSETGTAAAPPPTAAPTVAPNATLQKGASGAAVTALQTKLKALGYDVGAVDGDFGPATEKAVIAFQSKNGLTADGVVGAKTKAALGL